MVAQILSNTKPVHGPQATEAFSKLFFDDMIKLTLDLAFETAKAEAEAKAAAEKTDVKIPSKITVMRKQANLLYHAAYNDVKQQVVEFIEEARQKKKLLGALTEFFNELQRLTSYVFTVLMGGPTPVMGDEIDIQSFHVGITEVGNQFNQVYPEFNSGIMQPWKEFVKCMFSVAAAKEEGKPELSKDINSIDGAFENIPHDTSMLVSSSNTSTLFPHVPKPTSLFPLPTVPPLCLQSISTSLVGSSSNAVVTIIPALGAYECHRHILPFLGERSCTPVPSAKIPKLSTLPLFSHSALPGVETPLRLKRTKRATLPPNPRIRASGAYSAPL
ncbi:hypothetical protein DFJ58DRAFT_728845 [Suillus subalutaceus]|uniref:uncharacterized protein n=1 Tax=Suillus subalutaceus TaxID=48586 RepID=UPI001B85DB06|nr:uncharacterized protein DFJ58DRAFT_728845 [Suillus subalutaceus]KAG1851624.1 hypothetical protein DFJ58DRAFT_728845 [Suillus subalutaceus]